MQQAVYSPWFIPQMQRPVWLSPHWSFSFTLNPTFTHHNPQDNNKTHKILGCNHTKFWKIWNLFCKQLNCSVHQASLYLKIPKGEQQAVTVLFWNHVTWRQWSTHSSDLNFLFLVAGRGDEDEGKNKFAAGAAVAGEFSFLSLERYLPAV